MRKIIKNDQKSFEASSLEQSRDDFNQILIFGFWISTFFIFLVFVVKVLLKEEIARYRRGERKADNPRKHPCRTISESAQGKG